MLFACVATDRASRACWTMRRRRTAVRSGGDVYTVEGRRPERAAPAFITSKGLSPCLQTAI
jgi:hypothetical protein